VSAEERESFDLTAAVTDLVGVVGGEFLGSRFPGGIPPIGGAIFGVGIVQTLRYLINEVKTRLYSPREMRRVITVLMLIVRAIEREKSRGYTLRDDDFFRRAIDERTTAEELGDAVIYAAQREHEERKLPFIANLFAFFAFNSRIDQAMANYMVKLAGALTWRQYCILSSRTIHPEKGLRSAPFNATQRENPSQVFATLAECFELYRIALINFKYQFGLVTKIENMAIESIRLDGVGQYLHLGMHLSEIPTADVDDVTKLLTSP
jgi:hypothetical protein